MSGIALANLQINITANAGQVAPALRSVQTTAQEAMVGSQAAVAGFRDHLLRSSQEMEAAARQIGSGFTAANDELMAAAEQSERTLAQMGQAAANAAKQVDDAAQHMTGWQKAKENIKSALQEAYDWTVSTAAKMAATWAAFTLGGAIAGATAVLLANIYAAYKVLSFAAGLLTGSSYKSESIDALIAANERVKALQESLRISAPAASALDDVMSRLGLSAETVKGAYADAEKAMHANTEELDRLGVKYKDSNGQLISQHDFLVNVRDALEQYKDGWDRNQAAAAIGAGSYKQVQEALRVTDEELQKSHDRLNDYQLAIGPMSQQAVAQYEQAMRDFRNESKLTGEGFKRAIADAIMPTLTDLANFFKDGFPFAVRAFRGSVATVASMFYGIKLVADIVVDATKGALNALGDLFGGLGAAMERVLHGDFAGAADAMRGAWAAAGQSAGKAFDEMVADAAKARDRMLMAWGLDDRDQPIAGVQGLGGDRNRPGKAWMPKPKDRPEEGLKQSPYQNFLNELDQRTKKLQENEYASLRLKAAQLGEKEGVKDLTLAYEKIDALREAESNKILADYVVKLQKTREEQQFQTSILGETAAAQEILNAKHQAAVELEQTINQAKAQGKPLSEEVIAKLREETAAQQAWLDGAIRRRQEMQRSAEYGTKQALQTYVDDATNQAKAVEQLWTDAYRGAEDALTTFLSTGKLNVTSFVQTMIQEILRLQVIKPFLATLFSGGGFSAAVAGLFGGSGAAGTAGAGAGATVGVDTIAVDGLAADGGDIRPGQTFLVGEQGPELFRPAIAGTIVPNRALSAQAGAPAPTFIIQQSVGEFVTPTSLARATQAARDGAVMAFLDMRKRGVA